MSPGSSPPSLPPPSRSSPLSPLLPSSPLPLFSLPAVPTAVSHFLHNFPDLFNPSKRLPTALHDVQHHTKTSGPPLASRFCCLKGGKLQAERAEFDQMEQDGIVHRSTTTTSPWASPLHMVAKKDRTWQPCSNFIQLNLVTERDLYPLPNMLDFADRLSRAPFFKN